MNAAEGSKGQRLLAVDRRRSAILKRLEADDDEVWAGDFATLVDTEKWRPAFESLVKEGILTKRRDKRSRRLYYGLASPGAIKPCKP